jgi:hypothetical protein
VERTEQEVSQKRHTFGTDCPIHRATMLSVTLAGAAGLLISPHAPTTPGRAVRAPVMAAKVPHVAVVGAGWGGWAAAQTLLDNGCKVTLLDSLPDPTGETPYLTPTGKPFEAGTRGFWKDYPNIEALVASLGLKEEDVFTPFTNSSFYSPDGLEATAPVFSSATIPFTENPLPELPSPLGQVAATFQLFENIPVLDRVTVLGLLYAMADFTRDEHTFRGYDRMTAHELFLRMGISERFVQDFLKPTLLVRLAPLGPRKRARRAQTVRAPSRPTPCTHRVPILCTHRAPTLCPHQVRPLQPQP